MNSKRGFTLIELLIAIVIVGVLASVAVPAYGNYIVEARRADAKQELAKLTNIMENCRSMNQTYLNCLGGNDNTALDGSLSSDVSSYYAASTSTDIKANTYVLVLNTKGSQNRDVAACHTIGIDSNGVKFSGTVPGGTGFDVTKPDPGSCWR
jgi:type IV pilus assembly protein PilE